MATPRSSGSTGPASQREPRAERASDAGVDTELDGDVVAGFPIVVVLVTVVLPPDVDVDDDVVIPVLLLTVLTVVVLLGVDVIYCTTSPAATN